MACRNNAAYPIVVSFNDKDNFETTRFFTAFGKYTETDGAECVIFPSKENRSWSTFKVPWGHKHFEPFQKVIVAAFTGRWRVDLYSHYSEEFQEHVVMTGSSYTDREVMPYEGNENKLGKPVE